MSPAQSEPIEESDASDVPQAPGPVNPYKAALVTITTTTVILGGILAVLGSTNFSEHANDPFADNGVAEIIWAVSLLNAACLAIVAQLIVGALQWRPRKPVEAQPT